MEDLASEVDAMVGTVAVGEASARAGQVATRGDRTKIQEFREVSARDA